MDKIKKKKAFTLVELIIVITILAILSTIAFISFQSYFQDSRDSNRLVTIKNISGGLTLYNVKVGQYPSPDGKILSGAIQNNILFYQGELGENISKLLQFNSHPIDPATSNNYVYATDASNRHYQIATLLESQVGYDNFLPITYANNFTAKVEGNYPGYIKFSSGAERRIANIPGIIYNNTGTVDLLSTGVYYVVNKGKNLPYQYNKVLIQNTQPNQIIKDLMLSQNATLTGVNITGVTDENFGTYFSGASLESFNVEKINITDTSNLVQSVKKIVLGDSYVVPNVSIPETPTVDTNISQKSLMFDSDSAQYLSRTQSGGSLKKQFTVSAWIKRAKLGQNQMITQAYYDGTNFIQFGFDAQDRLMIYSVQSATDYGYVYTPQYRDTGAWMHVVFAVDTQNSVATDRFRLYVNNQRITSVSGNYGDPPLNYVTDFLNSGFQHTIGRNIDQSTYFNGYLSELNLIDGQGLIPSNFGYTESTTAQWLPKKYAGTYGTNGFYLDFADGTNLGKDKAGTNNWTTNGTITQSNNQMIDNPTNNFATLNPLSTTLNGGGLVNQNLKLYGLFGGDAAFANSTIIVDIDLYYFEVYAESNAGYGQSFLGIRDISSGSVYGKWVGNGADYTSYGVYGVAINFSTGKGWIKLPSNSWVSGDPVTGTTPTFTFPVGIYGLPTAITSRTSGNNHAGYAKWNFGQGGQSGLIYYTNAGGYFKYEPPTGFKALSTKNLPDPVIKKPNEHFDVVTYIGDGNTTKSINSLNFQPELVWLKNRDALTDHSIHDSMRGPTKRLRSNQSMGENTEAMQSFESNGFTVLGAGGVSNVLNNNYVAWNWKKSSTSGFDIVKYTGNGVNRIINHNIGKTPDFIIVKNIDSGNRNSNSMDWMVYHKDIDSSISNKVLRLNTTESKLTNNGNSFWNNTEPTNIGFSIGIHERVNYNLDNYVAYLWAEVPGYSKFGRYTGNGSADGPFIYTGFKPKYIMIKRIDNTDNWRTYDFVRSNKNPDTKVLYPNLSNIEDQSIDHFDWLSNGFKLRSTTNNTSGGIYIYAAFAESSFKYSNAR